MKKLLIMLLTLCALSVTHKASAQASFVGTKTNPTRAILNATADTALYQVSGSFTTATVVVTVGKTSGTMAGKVYIWNSPDGVQYTLRDSLSLTNVTTQYLQKDYINGIRQHWMVIQNGATTVAGTLNAKIWTAGR